MTTLGSQDSTRAGLGAMLFALGFPSLLTWAYFVALADASVEARWGVYSLGKAIQFAFPVAWMLAIAGWRPWSSGHHRGGSTGASVGLGLALGLVALAAMLALYHGWLKPTGQIAYAGTEIERKVRHFGVRGTPSFLALGAFYSLVHSFLEEYYWRWFVFGQLRWRMPWTLAVVLSSLGFMAHHVILLVVYFGWTPLAGLFSLAVAVGGGVWAWLYHRTGSLWGPWLSHLLADAGIFVVAYDLVCPLFAG